MIDFLSLLAMAGGLLALVVVSAIAVQTFQQTVKGIGERRRVVRDRLPGA